MTDTQNQPASDAAPDAASPTPPSDLEQRLAECQKLSQEYLAGWQRERADFQNYKKDEARRAAELREFAGARLITEILSVLDSFDIALDFVPDDLKGHRWIHGTEQIHFQLLDILKREGIEIIPTEDETFNPALHEAVEEVKSDKPEGTIVEEVQRGYVLNGRAIRPARVKVARKDTNL